MIEDKRKIVTQVLGSYHQKGDEHLYHCPYCGHHKKKMSVNFANGFWKCWVCDARGKNIYRIVRKFYYICTYIPQYIDTCGTTSKQQMELSTHFVNTILHLLLSGAPDRAPATQLPDVLLFLPASLMPMNPSAPLYSFKTQQKMPLSSIHYWHLLMMLQLQSLYPLQLIGTQLRNLPTSGRPVNTNP